MKQIGHGSVRITKTITPSVAFRAQYHRGEDAMTQRLSLALTAVLLTAGAVPANGQEHAHPAGVENLGTVHFETSCAPAVREMFDRGMALLHSFEFGRAVAAYETTLRQDSSCAMAAWGIAMSRWTNPFAVGVRSPQQIEQGRAAVEQARRIRAKTEREREYIDAVANLFENAGRPQQVRVEAYRDAMGRLAARYPQDTEAGIFYALSLAAAEDLNDKTYASRLQAVAILEPLFARQPNHPGLAHYIVHSYDVPALAQRALTAARRYAQIAPSAPHALHMPSHTFTRVGLWQESIDTNIASARVAKEQHATGEELHASDYQTYAYLQTAQDPAARRIVDSLPEMAARYDSPQTVPSAAPPSAARYAIAAIPARWALERGAWAEAAALEPRASDVPYADALTAFARAIGSARSGDRAAARRALDNLDALRARQAAMNEPYWTQQIDIQRQSAAAWLALVEGRRADAIELMRAAAEAEDRTEKAAVTPGPLAPAREQLAELLLDSSDARAALAEFQASLAKEPNRFRSLYGAARAAAATGDEAMARTYFSELLKMCSRADSSSRRELQEARAALGGGMP
jgi:hypothetical protein